MVRKKQTKLKYMPFYVLCITAIIGAFLFSDFNKKELTHKKDVNVESFDDQFLGGNSTCKLISDSLTYKFKYTVKEGIDFPFAGMNIRFDSLVEIDNKDVLEFGITSEEEGKIVVGLQTKTFQGNELLINCKVVCDIGFNRFSLPLSNFSPPDWWVKERKPSDPILKEQPEFIQVISFSNNVSVPKNQEDIIGVKGILLKSSNFTSKMILLLSFSLMLGWFVVLKVREKSIKRVEVVYQSVDSSKVRVVDLENKKLNEIVEFIGENYHNPKLTLRLIRKSVKITEKNISQIIKSNFYLSFNDYVNQIRLEEAKKMLLETKLNVNELSELCGFGSISSFNRIFKDKLGVSPTEFRSSERKKRI